MDVCILCVTMEAGTFGFMAKLRGFGVVMRGFGVVKT
jgi:hypothetical protein